ncbi:hypothetical protein BH23VER1_BH23VER1_28380 [soil metagenome]
MQGERRGPMGFEDARRIVGELFADEHREVAAQLSGLLWTFLLGASELRRDQVRSIVEETIPPERREEFMSTADMLREEGRMEGRTEGRTEGVAAMREAVLVSLEARFVTVPVGLRDTVESIADLDRLRKLLRDAHSCADLEVLWRPFRPPLLASLVSQGWGPWAMFCRVFNPMNTPGTSPIEPAFASSL